MKVDFNITLNAPEVVNDVMLSEVLPSLMIVSTNTRVLLINTNITTSWADPFAANGSVIEELSLKDFNKYLEDADVYR